MQAATRVPGAACRGAAGSAAAGNFKGTGVTSQLINSYSVQPLKNIARRMRNDIKVGGEAMTS